MTPLEILEEHRQRFGIRDMSAHCFCGWKSANGTMGPMLHRAHVAEVIEAWAQEQQARAWSAGFHKGRKTGNGSHVSTWPRNPYRRETP